MAIEIPGLNLSILRQETRVEAGQPLLISGRLTAFGLGIPAYIRIILEGPSYDPQTRYFDTFASPFSGDYSVNVIAEKGGQYEVFAQAMPPPLIPSTPLTPDAMLLLPSIAESTHPPIAVGDLVEGGVSYLDQYGASQFLQTPVQTPIEFMPYITVAPNVVVYGSGVPESVYAALAPTIPTPYTPSQIEDALAGPITAALENILMSPPVINPGQEATGVMTWRNTSAGSQRFDTVIYLIDQVGARHGPLQVDRDNIAAPQIPEITNLRLRTTGLPSGDYSVQGEIYNSVTGQLVDTITSPYALRILSIEAPELPEVPSLPELPTAPTANIIGQPSLNLSRQITVGDIWSGNVTLPTAGPAPYYISGELSLVSPTGQEVPAADYGRVLQPGETLSIPVNLNTYNLTPGSYTVFLSVADQLGNTLIEFPLGFLTLLESLAPLPEVPELPTVPTMDMIQTPYVNLPSQVTLGELWQGNITVPTQWPITLPQGISVPSYNFGGLVQLEAPTGQRFDVARVADAFTPGNPIGIPVSYDTSYLPEAADYNILLALTDFQGRSLFDAVIGRLNVLGVPLPEIPELSKFTAITVDLASREVEVGETITIPVIITHMGAAETVLLHAAIGDQRTGILGGFDEIWSAQKNIAVPAHAIPTQVRESLDINVRRVTSAAGVYSVYAKINTFIPKIESPHLINVIEVVEPGAPPGAPPEVGESKFIAIRVNISPQEIEVGDTLRVPVSYTHQGKAETVTLYAALGNQGSTSFDEKLRGQISVSVPADATATSRGEEIPIPITTALPAGKYDVYAKVGGMFPKAISDPVLDLITFITAPEVEASTFPFCDVDISFQRVTYGDTVVIPVSFAHRGQRENIQLYAAIGVPGAFGFDEKVHSVRDWVVPDDIDTKTRTVDISIPITQQLATGTYSVYGKVIRVVAGRREIISEIKNNVIEVYQVGAIGRSEFSDVTAKALISTVHRGDPFTILVEFNHRGQAESEWLYAAIGNQGTFSFDEKQYNRKAISVPAEDRLTDHVEAIDVPTDRLSPGTYDLYAKIGSKISPVVEDVVHIIE